MANIEKKRTQAPISLVDIVLLADRACVLLLVIEYTNCWQASNVAEAMQINSNANARCK